MNNKAASVAAYFASAREGRSQWWAWLLGFAFILALSFSGIIGLALITAWVLPPSEAAFYFELLLTFLPIFIAIPLIQRVWHLRPVKTLLTSASKFRWGHFWRTVFIIFIFYSIVSFAEYLIVPQEFEGLQFNTDMKTYLPLLLITLILVPFQAASEEFLCRGYLNQALIKYLGSPWLVFAITSAGFAALHMANPEASGQMGPYLASIFLFGMAMCVLLFFEGGIESAIGAHIANNIFVFGLLGYEDPDLPNTAFFTLGEPVIGWNDFALELVLTAAVISLILWANRRWGRSN